MPPFPNNPNSSSIFFSFSEKPYNPGSNQLAVYLFSTSPHCLTLMTSLLIITMTTTSWWAQFVQHRWISNRFYSVNWGSFYVNWIRLIIIFPFFSENPSWRVIGKEKKWETIKLREAKVSETFQCPAGIRLGNWGISEPSFIKSFRCDENGALNFFLLSSSPDKWKKVGEKTFIELNFS